jgi:hypothetical protein
MRLGHLQKLRRDKRAASPAISSVIMIAAVMVMVLVAMSYASNILDSRLAENEFGASRQFMLATGLQIDDVAWTVGRTQTISYSSRFGHVEVVSLALNYSVDMHHDSDPSSVWEKNVFSNVTTGMILFNMPISEYNMGNNYFERILPNLNNAFLQEGPAAPVSHVFVRELLPMNDGSFLRIAAVSSIRVLNSSIDGPTQSASTMYCKFFLPTLERSSKNPALSQSVTMTGGKVTKIIRSGIDKVNITVSFPSVSSGFNSTFFNFDRLVETKTLPAGSVVEFYIGNVIVSQGLV